MERKIAWEKYSQEEMEKVFAFAENYRQFLSLGKTERECVKLAVAEAKAHGYEDLQDVIVCQLGNVDFPYSVGIPDQSPVTVKGAGSQIETGSHEIIEYFSTKHSITSLYYDKVEKQNEDVRNKKNQGRTINKKWS